MPGGAQRELLRWIGEAWGESVAQVLEAMAGERPAAAWTAPGPRQEAGGAALRWSQELDLAEGATLLATLAEDSWRAVGSRALGAAGGEQPPEEEVRGTCLEVLAQSFALLAQAVGQRVGRPVAASGRQADGSSDAEDAGSVAIRYAGGAAATIQLGCSRELLQALAASDSPPEDRAAPPAAAAGEDSPDSATLELLRDIELPVSISFGRAQLPLQDVLKLTAGSVIELDRTISEPVSLLVNNTVVALAEVVVIEGNYGVRIREVMSREKLLRSSGLR